MVTRNLRMPLVVLNAFLALTAIAGSVGLLSGLNAPPLELLAGSMFRDYTVPGLALLFFVGGASLLAVVMSLRRHRLGPLMSMISGGMILAFEIIEVIIIGSPAGTARNLQLFYGIYGLALILMAQAQRLARRREHLRNEVSG